MADTDEVRATDLTGQLLIQLKSTGRTYTLDTSDTTTTDDGENLIRDANGLAFVLNEIVGLDGEDGVGTGDVSGPASSKDSHVALFDGTDGKTIKDGGALGTAAFSDIGDTVQAYDANLLAGIPTQASNASVNVVHATHANRGYGFWDGNDHTVTLKSADNGGLIASDMFSIWKTVSGGTITITADVGCTIIWMPSLSTGNRSLAAGGGAMVTIWAIGSDNFVISGVGIT